MPRTRKAVGRPKGQTDKTKRKTRSVWKAEHVLFLKNNWGSMSRSEIAKAVNKSIHSVGQAARELKLKYKCFSSDISKRKSIEDLKGVCGIYGICNLLGKKIYIGSSVDCGRRIRTHQQQLKQNIHYNSNLQKEYNEDFWFTLFETCEESELLDRESYYLNKYVPEVLYNGWITVELDDELRPYLNRAAELLSAKTLEINENGCHIWKGRMDGKYGAMQVSREGVVKYFRAHRVSYYKEYGEYPKLIRHMCNNPKCVNPKHLQPGSHRQNILDRSREFDKEFEKVWVELKADAEKITEYFKWEKCRWSQGNPNISSQVYTWERKLGLREKYQDIYNNSGRRITRSSEEVIRDKKLKEEKRRLKKEKAALQAKKALENLDSRKAKWREKARLNWAKEFWGIYDGNREALLITSLSEFAILSNGKRVNQ